MKEKFSRKRLTNEEVDRRLNITNIRRVDDYINKRTPILFKCISCNYEWKTRPQGVINHKTGCPNCNSNIRLTNEIIDEKLKDKNIKRISSYITGSSQITVQCLIKDCGHVWELYTFYLSGNYFHGCSKCAKNCKLSKIEVNNRLILRNIELITDYVNVATTGTFRCLNENCNYIWNTLVGSVLNGTGCIICSGRKLTNEIIDDLLKDRNILRIDNYIGALIKIKFKCLNDNCDNIWEVAPNEIINPHKLHGCPLCSFGKNEKIVNLTLKKSNINFHPHFHIKKLNNNLPNLIVDFYIPDYNLIIEYNGGQHYKPVCFHGMSLEKAEKILNFKLKEINY